MSFLVHSARKLDADGAAPDFWIASVTGGTITAVGSGNGWREYAAVGSVAAHDILDAAGRWVAPGFIDLHVHGGGAHRFDDGADEIRAGLEAHRRHGTTRSVISLVANPIARVRQSLEQIAHLTVVDPLILGSHLEGPFLAPNRRGAHDSSHLIAPTPAHVAGLLEAAAGTLRQLTIAPELPGAMAAIEVLSAARVVVAIGHTEADYDLTRRAIDQGARMLTHAFNAMPGIGHRAPGPIVAAFEDERVILELILDGRHVHPAVAQVAFRSAPGRVALVTDAMAAAGAPEGHYFLGDLPVTVADGMAMVSGTDTIAGSTLTQDAALRLAIVTTGLDPVGAVAAVTAVPARALGLDDRLGYLRPGYAADAVLLDADWQVTRVWANGEAVG